MKHTYKICAVIGHTNNFETEIKTTCQKNIIDVFRFLEADSIVFSTAQKKEIADKIRRAYAKKIKKSSFFHANAHSAIPEYTHLFGQYNTSFIHFYKF